MNTKVVLVVDDHELVRSMVVGILESNGFYVLSAASGPEAIQLMRERGQDIGCVLQDLSMPHMSGEQVIAELLQINPELPILVYSAYEASTISYRLDKLNIAGYLQKPFEPEVLVAHIQNLMQIQYS